MYGMNTEIKQVCKSVFHTACIFITYLHPLINFSKTDFSCSDISYFGNTVDPYQLASDEVILSGSTLFSALVYKIQTWEECST